jgi:hypothetical protein
VDGSIRAKAGGAEFRPVPMTVPRDFATYPVGLGEKASDGVATGRSWLSSVDECASWFLVW